MFTAPDGVVELLACVMRKLPALLSSLQALVAPRPVGCAVRLALAPVKPDGVVHEPVAAVQASALTDRTAVPVVGSALESNT